MIRKLIAQLIYPEIFTDYDNAMDKKENHSNKEIEINLKYDNLSKEYLKQDKMIEDLNSEIIDLKLKEIDLSKFKSTRSRKINGTNMLINKWLSNRQHIEDAKTWGEANLKFPLNSKLNDDEWVHSLRKLIYNYFKKDPHVPDKIDTWQTVSELIANKFKGDCDDWMTFIYSLIIAFSELHNRSKIKDNLFSILCGVNMKEGWNDGNHASLLYRNSEGKFYIIETAVSNGSDYIQDALNKFGVIDYANNIRYGRIVFMSNYENNYYQPRLW